MHISQGLLITEILTVIISAISLRYNIINNERNYNNRKIAKLFTIVSFLLIACVVILVQFFTIPDETKVMDNTNLKIKAQEYFGIEEYIKAVEIYQNDNLDTDVVALNNLAYIYENGLGVSKDYDVAESLYLKASKMDNVKAKKNYISFVLNHPRSYSQIIEALDLAYSISDEPVIKWMAIGGSKKPLNEINESDYKRYAQEYLNNGFEDKKDFIKNYFYEEEIPIEYYSGISNSDFVSYVQTKKDKKLFVGAYKVVVENGEKSYTPIYTTVQQTSAVVIAQKLPIGDQSNTEFIYIKK